MDNKLFGIDVSRSIEAVQDEPVTDETLKKKRRGKVFSEPAVTEKTDDIDMSLNEDDIEQNITHDEITTSSREVDIIDVVHDNNVHPEQTR